MCSKMNYSEDRLELLLEACPLTDREHIKFLNTINLQFKQDANCECGYWHKEGLVGSSSIFPCVIDANHGEWSVDAIAAFDRNVRKMYARLNMRKKAEMVFRNLDLFKIIRAYVLDTCVAYNLDSLCERLKAQRYLLTDDNFIAVVRDSTPSRIDRETYVNLFLRERVDLFGFGGIYSIQKLLWYHYQWTWNEAYSAINVVNHFLTLYENDELVPYLPLSQHEVIRLGWNPGAMLYSLCQVTPLSRASSELRKVLVGRTRCMNLFKTLVIARIVQFVDARPVSPTISMWDQILDVYLRWGRKGVLSLSHFYYDGLEIIEVLCGFGNSIIDTCSVNLRAFSPETLAILLLVFVFLAIMSLPFISQLVLMCKRYIIDWFMVPRLKKTDKSYDLSSAFVSSVEVKTSGARLYHVNLNGQMFTLPEAPKDVPIVLEMSMPGSTFVPSSWKPGVLAIVATDDLGVCEFVGMGVRIGDYLVTAAHVANLLFSGIKRPALVPFSQGLNTKLRLMKMVSLDIENFDPERSVDFGTLDVFAIYLNKDVWSKLGVSEINTLKSSLYNQQIASVGVQDGVLVSAVGKTLPGSGLTELRHTASTERGFSGGPLFSGNSMVGMHYAAQGDCNTAIRIEQIVGRLRVVEHSSSLEFSERSEVVKLGGREGKIEVDELSHHWWVGTDGRVVPLDEDYYRKKLHDYDRYEMEDDEQRDTFMRDADYNDAPAELDPYGDDPYYADNGRITTRNAQLAKSKKRRPALVMESAGPNVLALLNGTTHQEVFDFAGRAPAVFCGSYPPVQTVADEMLSAVEAECVKLGYDPTAYGEPEITKNTEEISLVKHLCLFSDRVSTVKDPPTELEVDRILFLLEDLLQHNKYEPDSDYKQRSCLHRLIDSSLVKCSKSAGFPYGADGHPTNGDVLRAIGADGVVDRVLQEWDEPYENKVFLKTEPHKRSKIDAGLLRIITCMPLHKMIKHQALFNKLTAKGVENWRKSPIVFFSPQVPGDPENLWKRFTGRVLETDKTNWDFNMFDWVYEIVSYSIQNLAVKPSDWSDEQFEEYLLDVDNAIKEVYKDSVYRCSNGSRYRMKVGGIMKSGWVLTYFANSLAQLILHLLCSIRLGMTDEDIIKSPIIVGGDDILQGVPDDFDVDRLLSEYSRIGVHISDYKLHDSMEGAEFFSNKFSMYDGMVRYVPCRFTKHLYSLRNTKPEHLCAALVSHMMNYCWEPKKFGVFDKMFIYLRENHPHLVDESLHRTLSYWRYKTKGYESVF